MAERECKTMSNQDRIVPTEVSSCQTTMSFRWVITPLGESVHGRLSVLSNWPHRFPFLKSGEAWFIPAILCSLALLLVAVDLAKVARRAS